MGAEEESKFTKDTESVEKTGIQKLEELVGYRGKIDELEVSIGGLTKYEKGFPYGPEDGFSVNVTEPGDDYSTRIILDRTGKLVTVHAIFEDEGWSSPYGDIPHARDLLRRVFENIDHIKDSWERISF